MSSSTPTSVPTITSMGASPTPPKKQMRITSEYFSMMSHSPGQGPPPGNNIMSPVGLSRSSTSLLTPPISETQSKQERGGYFTSNHGGLLSKSDRMTSSDHRSNPSLSPGVSSGGSFYSSDTGRSPCSYSSGEYLSPPQFQGDDDKPPYISHRRSSNSLSMMRKKLRRADTIPNDKGIKVKRRHRRHGCRHHKIKKGIQGENSSWEEHSCQIAPTATTGNKQLCRDHTGHKVPKSTRYGNTDTFGRLIHTSMPGPAPPINTRRWSSVEVGAHQVSLPSMLSSSPLCGNHNERGSKDEVVGDDNITKNIYDRHRSSTFTRGAIDNDIVRVVRERLTFRKISRNTVESPVVPPLSITVRRASNTSGISGVTRGPIEQDSRSDGGSGTETPRADFLGQMQGRKPSDTYLITNKDIEAITLLIAENLRQNLQHKVSNDARSTGQSRHETLNTNASSTEHPEQPSAMIVTNTAGDRLLHTTGGPVRSDYLQVEGLKQPRRKSVSSVSLHEVIWNGSRNSTRSFGSSASEQEDGKYYDTSSGPGSSPEILPEDRKKEEAIDKGDAFDPNNARESINEWSWKLPQSDLKMPVTSSESESTDVTPRTKTGRAKRRPLLRTVSSTPKERTPTRARPFPRYAASHEQLQDVVSFPPLVPRKATSEWFSPLPDIETVSTVLTPPIPVSRSLYSLGVDVTIGPSGSAVSSAPFASLFRSGEVIPSQVAPSQLPGINFKPDYGFGGLDTVPGVDDRRRKSVVKPHPKATARNGQTFAMGSSIGAHSGERRRSSAPRIQRVQRVRTIDNVHKGERDEPPSRWRAPSVCPPRLSVGQLSISPAEPEDSRDQRSDDRVPEILTRLSRLRSGITDRMTLVEAKSPRLPKSDCAGIYGTITGTLRRTIATPCLEDTSRHTCDDCENSPRTPSIDWIG